MTPPISTYHQIIRLERAAALARAEKTRVTRDQELVLLAHAPNQADRQVGLDSFRARLGSLVSGFGSLAPRRQRIDSHPARCEVAPATR